VAARAVPAPALLFFNHALADELGLGRRRRTGGGAQRRGGAALFAGNTLPTGRRSRWPQAYAGHQFGGFSPQLGDGRALLLGEVIDRQGRRRDIAFKGSGRTPFSRGGDGKAAVGPMLREVLIGEAMHALGIPTTRALAVVATGEPVLARTAAARRGADARGGQPPARRHLPVLRRARRRGALRQLPTTRSPATTRRWRTRPSPTWGCCAPWRERQAALIAQWMNVGFIHGVMNTDNMTLSARPSTTAPAPSWRPTTRRRCSAPSTTAAAMPTATSP
jgi:serine/tyrosine/threonine adenylyltransferase